MNRVGDFGFILGLLLVWTTFGSLDYSDVFANAHESAAANVMNVLEPFGGSLDVSVLTVICLLLFTGAVGKSAQLPLHVWLPDAMEGPTPISALIHAATMVTAGVFMVARLAPLYNLSPTAMIGCRDHRRHHDGARGDHRPDPDRHQAGRRLLDHEPARLHDDGLRPRRLCRRHVSSH